MPVIKCPDCGKVVSLRFGVHNCTPPVNTNTVLEKIRQFCAARSIPIDLNLERKSEDELTLLWIKLQMSGK